MQQYKLVIFDWDGTLMDSVARIVACMQAAAKQMSLPVPTAADVEGIIGLSLAKAIKQLFGEISEGQVEQLIAYYRHQYVEVDDTPSPLFADVPALLTQLQSQNRLLAVATGKAREGLQRVMQASGLESYFHSSRCSDEAQSKPHPEMIQSILEELNIGAEQAVMIGDTSFDLEMAQRAGVASIGVTFGAHETAQLLACQPIAVVDSIAELQQLFR